MYVFMYVRVYSKSSPVSLGVEIMNGARPVLSYVHSNPVSVPLKLIYRQLSSSTKKEKQKKRKYTYECMYILMGYSWHTC